MSPEILGPLLLSCQILLVTLVLHIFSAPLFAYAISGPSNVLRRLLDLAVTLPLVFPPIAVGFFLLLLLGRQGWIGAPLGQLGIEVIFSFTGITLAAYVAGLPLAVKPLTAAVESRGQPLFEAASTLGVGRFKAYLLIVIPVVRRTLAAGLALATGRALGEVGISLMLGGNIIGRTDTLSLAIYNAVFDGNFKLALTLSLILGLLSIGIFILIQKLGEDKTGF